MNIDALEVVEYIEASNNIIEAQSSRIEKLEKQSSEKDATIQSLQAKLTENNKVAHQAVAAEKNEQKVASSSQWGSGEKQETSQGTMRESERVLYQRFGVPIN